VNENPELLLSLSCFVVTGFGSYAIRLFYPEVLGNWRAVTRDLSPEAGFVLVQWVVASS
jgi:hypothetical protein